MEEWRRLHSTLSLWADEVLGKVGGEAVPDVLVVQSSNVLATLVTLASGKNLYRGMKKISANAADPVLLEKNIKRCFSVLKSSGVATSCKVQDVLAGNEEPIIDLILNTAYLYYGRRLLRCRPLFPELESVLTKEISRLIAPYRVTFSGLTDDLSDGLALCAFVHALCQDFDWRQASQLPVRDRISLILATVSRNFNTPPLLVVDDFLIGSVDKAAMFLFLCCVLESHSDLLSGTPMKPRVVLTNPTSPTGPASPTDIADLATANQQLDIENHDLQVELESVTGSLASAQAERDFLRAELDSFIATGDSAAATRATEDDARKQVRQAQVQQAQAERKVHFTTQENDRLKARVENLERSLTEGVTREYDAKSQADAAFMLVAVRTLLPFVESKKKTVRDEGTRVLDVVESTVRRSVKSFGGKSMSYESCAEMFVFATARQAVMCSSDLRRRLVEVDWPIDCHNIEGCEPRSDPVTGLTVSGPPVDVGIHYGVSKPIENSLSAYFGVPVAHLRAIEALAPLGTSLASSSVVEAILADYVGTGTLPVSRLGLDGVRILGFDGKPLYLLHPVEWRAQPPRVLLEGAGKVPTTVHLEPEVAAINAASDRLLALTNKIRDGLYDGGGSSGAARKAAASVTRDVLVMSSQRDVAEVLEAVERVDGKFNAIAAKLEAVENSSRATREETQVLTEWLSLVRSGVRRNAPAAAAAAKNTKKGAAMVESLLDASRDEGSRRDVEKLTREISSLRSENSKLEEEVDRLRRLQKRSLAALKRGERPNNGAPSAGANRTSGWDVGRGSSSELLTEPAASAPVSPRSTLDAGSASGGGGGGGGGGWGSPPLGGSRGELRATKSFRMPKGGSDGRGPGSPSATSPRSTAGKFKKRKGEERGSVSERVNNSGQKGSASAKLGTRAFDGGERGSKGVRGGRDDSRDTRSLGSRNSSSNLHDDAFGSLSRLNIDTGEREAKVRARILPPNNTNNTNNNDNLSPNEPEYPEDGLGFLNTYPPVGAEASSDLFVDADVTAMERSEGRRRRRRKSKHRGGGSSVASGLGGDDDPNTSRNSSGDRSSVSSLGGGGGDGGRGGPLVTSALGAIVEGSGSASPEYGLGPSRSGNSIDDASSPRGRGGSRASRTDSRGKRGGSRADKSGGRGGGDGGGGSRKSRSSHDGGVSRSHESDNTQPFSSASVSDVSPVSPLGKIPQWSRGHSNLSEVDLDASLSSSPVSPHMSRHPSSEIGSTMLEASRGSSSPLSPIRGSGGGASRGSATRGSPGGGGGGGGSGEGSGQSRRRKRSSRKTSGEGAKPPKGSDNFAEAAAEEFKSRSISEQELTLATGVSGGRGSPSGEVSAKKQQLHSPPKSSTTSGSSRASDRGRSGGGGGGGGGGGSSGAGTNTDDRSRGSPGSLGLTRGRGGSAGGTSRRRVSDEHTLSPPPPTSLIRVGTDPSGELLLAPLYIDDRGDGAGAGGSAGSGGGSAIGSAGSGGSIGSVGSEGGGRNLELPPVTTPVESVKARARASSFRRSTSDHSFPVSTVRRSRAIFQSPNNDLRRDPFTGAERGGGDRGDRGSGERGGLHNTMPPRGSSSWLESSGGGSGEGGGGGGGEDMLSPVLRHRSRVTSPVDLELERSRPPSKLPSRAVSPTFTASPVGPISREGTETTLADSLMGSPTLSRTASAVLPDIASPRSESPPHVFDGQGGIAPGAAADLRKSLNDIASEDGSSGRGYDV